MPPSEFGSTTSRSLFFFNPFFSRRRDCYFFDTPRIVEMPISAVYAVAKMAICGFFP